MLGSILFELTLRPNAFIELDVSVLVVVEVFVSATGEGSCM